MCAGLDGVRACLVLSADGLTLGSYPADGEALGREVWDRFEQVAAPQRGFLDLGEEVWVIARRGPYTAVLVSAVALRPGLLLDRVEALLRAAEETRMPDPQPGPPSPPEMRRPRPHRERQSSPEEPSRKAGGGENGQVEAPKYSPPEALRSAAGKVVDVASLEEGELPADADTDMDGADEQLPAVDPNDIDRVALAREFGRLIAESEPGEEQ
jgi:hypothetical protein